jgi:hypothetical protein
MPARARRDFLKILDPDDVVDAESFAAYCQQVLGSAYPKARDLVILRTKLKDFFAEKPEATYYTLCRVVQWARMKKKRPSDSWKVPDMWKWAWQDGALSELDPK